MKKINGKVARVPLKNDYQIVLNTVLGIYYQMKDYIFLDDVIKKIEIPWDDVEVFTAHDALMEDGYIVHQTPDQPKNFGLRVAKITGKGKLFFENGGYKDEKTQFDKIIDWAKNNKIIAYLLVGFIVIAGIKEVFDIVVELIKWINE